MTTWPVLANWTGPIVMIGFGSIGRGTLPLILRHINCDRARVTVIDPDASWSQLAEDQGVRFVKEAITRQNYKTVLKPMLTAGPGPAFMVNLSVDVDSLAIMRLARETGALYIDTVIEPWAGFYYNTRLSHGDRTNYMLREGLLALKKELGPGTTAVSCCGANPGMVSWFVKQALIDIAAATKLKTSEPDSRDGWAKLMKRLGVKGIHIAERDTQRAKTPKPFDTFINTWSVEGFISEGLQPAELGWGTHEKKMPPLGRRHKSGCGAAIYIERPGADTRVRTWTPTQGPHFGFLVTHNEAISISDYYTVREGRKAVYRPTCHYAYHPSNDAVLSWHELLGAGGKRQSRNHILEEHEIVGRHGRTGCAALRPQEECLLVWLAADYPGSPQAGALPERHRPAGHIRRPRRYRLGHGEPGRRHRGNRRDGLPALPGSPEALSGCRGRLLYGLDPAAVGR